MEDLQDVEVELKRQETSLLELENKLRTRVLCFNSNILKLHKILTERKKVLDTAEATLASWTGQRDLVHKLRVRVERILRELD